MTLTCTVHGTNLVGKYHVFPMEKVLQVPIHLRLLQDAFRERRFTMRGVAKNLDVDHKTVHNYVFGKTPIPSEYASKLAKATLSTESAERFRKTWEKDEGQRITDLNKSKKKQAAIQEAKRKGFIAVISNYVTSGANEKALSTAFQQMRAVKSDNLYRFLDLNIERRPVDVFVDVYRKEANGEKSRVILITADYGLVFFPGEQQSEWTLNDGTMTTVSGTLGTDEDWKGPIALFKKYCDDCGVDPAALVALAQMEIQNAMELEPESYEANQRVIVEKKQVSLYAGHLGRMLDLIRKKQPLKGQDRFEVINHLASLLGWMQSLENRADETVSAKARLFSKIGSILHKLHW